MHLPVLFLIALASGVGLGYAFGGRLRELAHLPPGLLVIPWAAAVVQVLLSATAAGTAARHVLVLGTYVLVATLIVAAMRATRRMAWPALARIAVATLVAGWALNTAVITANGGMPVSQDALAAAGYNRDLDVTSVSIRKHVSASHQTTFMFLGDVIPIRPLRRVVSAGDIAILVGLSMFVAAAMARRRTPGPESL